MRGRTHRGPIQSLVSRRFSPSRPVLLRFISCQRVGGAGGAADPLSVLNMTPPAAARTTFCIARVSIQKSLRKCNKLPPPPSPCSSLWYVHSGRRLARRECDIGFFLPKLHNFSEAPFGFNGDGEKGVEGGGLGLHHLSFYIHFLPQPALFTIHFSGGRRKWIRSATSSHLEEPREHVEIQWILIWDKSVRGGWGSGSGDLLAREIEKKDFLTSRTFVTRKKTNN